MRQKGGNRIRGKRAVIAGLFLGVLAGFCACTKPAVQHGVTDTPLPYATDGVIPTPIPGEPTKEPVITEVPDTPTTIPSVTPESLPTDILLPTSEPETTPIEFPGVTEPVTPDPGKLPTPALTKKPEGTLSPMPEPTGQPAYDTLLQNGWQRTEDFFGCREIFFSGKFDHTELLAVPGRYEYRYTASSDAGIRFSIIGEEGIPIQQFLDELAQGTLECYIEMETEEDYRYHYVDGEYAVTGRIYSCGTEEILRHMHVELRRPATEELPTEGDEFYLRER